MHLAQAGDAIGEVGALVVAEPSYNIPRVGHKGALWMEMSSAGKTAHGSMPWEGDNALYKASRAVGKLEDFDFNVAPHAILGGNSINVGTMHAGQNVNSVPDSAKFRVDVRTIPGMDHGDIRKTLAGYLGDDVAEVAPFVDVGGVWTDPDHPWVSRVFDLVAPHLGERPEVGALPFFTDASALTPAYGGVPTLILGPGDTHMAHQTDEFCMVERIPQAVAIYKRHHRRLAGGIGSAGVGPVPYHSRQQARRPAPARARPHLRPCSRFARRAVRYEERRKTSCRACRRSRRAGDAFDQASVIRKNP